MRKVDFVFGLMALLWATIRYALFGVREPADALLVGLALFVIIDSLPNRNRK